MTELPVSIVVTQMRMPCTNSKSNKIPIQQTNSEFLRNVNRGTALPIWQGEASISAPEFKGLVLKDTKHTDQLRRTCSQENMDQMASGKEPSGTSVFCGPDLQMGNCCNATDREQI